MFGEIAGPLLFKPQHMKNMVNCLTVVVPASNMPNSNLEGIMERFASGITVEDTSSAIRRGNIEYYAAEVELNAKFRLYVKNCSAVFAGYNTVAAQLKIKSKRPYTIIGGDEELPLGEEFQTLVRCFVDTHEKKPEKRYLPAAKLIEQLLISLECKRLTESARLEMDDLNIKCFQVLRAIIHNEERKLPEGWETRTSEHEIEKGLKLVAGIQNMYDQKGAIRKALPHLATRNDLIAKEVLAFLCIMLFNANNTVQQSMLTYFFSTREEVFFMAVRDRMALSTNSIKEKRSLQTQHEAKLKESSDSKRTKNMFVVTLMALRQIQAYEDAMRQQRLSGWTRKTTKSCVKPPPKKALKAQKEVPKTPEKTSKEKTVSVKTKKQADKKDGTNNGGILKKEVTFVNPKAKEKEALMQDGKDTDMAVKMQEHEAESVTTDTSAFEYRNDGYIELVLKVMARMCDGQNKHLQDYLREQPDNVKSFDIIAEVTRFLNVVYSNINSKNIDLVIQLFETMNEFTAGNQDNRVVIYDNKIIDYINFILRSGEFGDCSTEKTLELRKSISNLVMSLIEENGPGATEVALEVKDTLDKKAVLALLANCYERHQTDKTKVMELKALEEAMADPMGSQGKMASTRSLNKGKKLLKGVMKKQKEEFAEDYMDVGFGLYLILARMCDIDPKLLEYLRMTPLQAKAFSFYKKNCMSIEVVKDDYLQKINFRVKNRRVLREEVKEKLKWGVDRSSPSNKIRDLMGWTKDIMKDIAYQQKIIKNPLTIMLTKGWLVWNHLITVLSFAINILMLVTWRAKASLETPGIMKNVTGIPPLLRDHVPEITTLTPREYNISILVMGGTHNFLSLLVFISYFVCNHPRLPSIRSGINACKKLSLRKKQDDEEEEDKKRKHVSKLDARFFSVTTIYYAIFLGMSVGGTLSNGYFFAFHLLNIVNNNQLLSGVIKAVTQNGQALLWVGVLGLVIFYLYGMIGFALMRSMFDPGDYLYCNTLWQCTVTVIRYGLIGDLFEVMKPHGNEKTFEKFGVVVFYHVSFFIFITTIGLNIVLGIIVDTFSELRDLKWTAESDMRDTCFICSRNSYDFEHHGKGFDHHVRHEHNMWSYIFFFIHLNGTKINDYTAMEMFVFKLLGKENYDFFPLDRALSLASMGKDATETKLDDLLGQVTSIVEKQRVEELEKKRCEERLKQKQWEQKHRLSSFRRRARLPGPPDQDANDMKSQALATDDARLMQISSFPGHRRQSSADYTGHGRPSIADLAARVSESIRHSSITDGRLDQGPRQTLADIGSRPSLSDHANRLAYLDSRRSSMGDHGGGLSVFRQGSSSRYDRLERQRTLRSMSPVRFDGDQYGQTRYFRGHHSPSRYEVDDPYVRSLSPVRYDQSARSPARSRQGSDPDIFGIISLSSSRREIPTRDLSCMLSPRYTESRQTSPRGTMTFFPDTESLQGFRGDQVVSAEEFPPPETVEGVAERETDADSVHSGDYSRYENRF
ncbi:hypothetical protein BsWGS_22781 [Bradybaena similaris]